MPPRLPFRLAAFPVALLCAVASLAAGPLSAPASAEGSAGAIAQKSGAETYAVASTGTLTLTGHGYGHGRGMSQYGAEGAARQGLTAEQIVAFYYPGTVLGATQGKVRVLISADTSDDVEVLARKNLKVRDLATGVMTVVEAGSSRYRLVANGAGTRLEGFSGVWRSLADYPAAAEFAGGGAKSLVTPSGVVRYRGALRSAASTTDPAIRSTVNVLSMNKYLRGVVPREIPTSWSPEALRAQAIAARTYAAHDIADNPEGAAWDICDTTACQVYGGAAGEASSTNQAIRSTTGMVLLDPATGAPAFTQFSSSSGGFTAAGSVPYLVAAPDPYDDWAGNPVHNWSKTVSDRALEGVYPKVGDLQKIEVTARDGNGDWGGRIESVNLVGSAGTIATSGDMLRTKLGLRSTWFTVSPG